MRRFLVVGCGGSGAVTLAYMMDQLRSDLARARIDKIPAGWQFVSIDVPSAPGGMPSGLLSVREQHGVYFGVAPAGGRYPILDGALSRQLAKDKKLGTLATWAPRDPESVTVPVAHGAGQYRAIGRMVTLNQLSGIRQALQHAWDRLNEVPTLAEMRGMRFPGGERFDQDQPPLVLVVSSMAGGSGASMALDVCRLLSTISGLDPLTIGLFMVTADVFDSLGEAATRGVRPNALAMLGEIIANQLGAAREPDTELLAALGMGQGDSAPTPFARVFPVSRTMGEQAAPFGNSQDAIYRGLARGLSGMMMSGSATDQFIEYDLANKGAEIAGERDNFGWGAGGFERIPWGTYGFSSLSMGRERYAEYAAQRLARRTVDHLLEGHRRQDSQAAEDQQVADLLDGRWPEVLSGTALVHNPNDPRNVRDWLMFTVLPEPELRRIVGHIADTVVRPVVPSADGLTAKQWVPEVERGVARRREVLKEEARRAGEIQAFLWYPDLIARIEDQVTGGLAAVGLPYATALVKRLAAHLSDNIRAGAEDLAKHGDVDIAKAPPRLTAALRLPGTIKSSRTLVDEIIEDYGANIRRHVYAALAAKIAELAAASVAELCNPLVDALDEAQTQLRRAQGSGSGDGGIALLATDHYGAWPAEDKPVPLRFEEANNEVMLTRSSEFPDQYVHDVRLAVAEDVDNPPRLPRATQLAAECVTTGLWETADGTTAPGEITPLVERVTDWQPRSFSVDPRTRAPLGLPAAARYDVHLRPGELLSRARAYVGRTGRSFDQFCRVSLRQFLDYPDGRDSVREQRRQFVVSKFVDALKQARPLASVNTDALKTLHPGQELKYRYKFSEIPFAHMAIGAELRKVMRDDPSIQYEIVDPAFVEALTEETSQTRIDIFGSYPNYSPLVYRSVLDPAARQWDKATIGQQTEFWKWRRARPLAAALPMTEVERRTLTAGWFLGAILGMVERPATPDEPVRVWDREHSGWLNFPHPLLTPPEQRTDIDWLPAILESILLAMAHSHDEPVMHSLRPYRALRGIYDSGHQGPATGIVVRSSDATVVEWLATGNTPSGSPSVPEVGGGSTIEERAKNAIDWLTRVRQFTGVNYVPPGMHNAPGGGKFSVIADRRLATQTPLFRDIAPDVHLVLGWLIELFERCVPLAQNYHDPRSTSAMQNRPGGF